MSEMKTFKFGQIVKSTPLAIERRLFKTKQTGVVIYQDDPMTVRIVIKGKKMSIKYSVVFWE